MPIITPAYPSMCATYNITKSAMTIIQRELHRGGDLTDKIMLGKGPWSDLFVKHTFFTSDYKYYISVITASKSKDAHKTWSGYVESKVRVLVQGLERHQSIALAHAFNKGYDRKHRCQTDEEVHLVQDGSLSFVHKDDGGATKLSEDGQTVLMDEKSQSAPVEVFTTTHYIGLELNAGK
jgi:poly(A) polymerase